VEKPIEEPPPLQSMASDTFGDPLPKGVLRRFGNARYRALPWARLRFARDGRLWAFESIGTAAGDKLIVRDVASTAAPSFELAMEATSLREVATDGSAFVRAGKDTELWNVSTRSKVVLAEPVSHVVWAGPAQTVVAAKHDVRKTNKGSVPAGTTSLVVVEGDGALRKLVTLDGALDEWAAAQFRDRVVVVTSDVNAKKRSTQLVVVELDGKTRRIDLGSSPRVDRFAVDPAGSFALFLRGESLYRVDLDSGDPPRVIRDGLANRGDRSLTIGKDGAAAVAHNDSIYLATAEQNGGDRAATVDGEILELAFSPDGSTLVALSDNGLVRRVDVQTGDEIERPSGHSAVASGAISDDGRWLALAGDRLCVWQVDGGALSKCVDTESPILRVAFDGDGLVTVHSNGAGSRWTRDALERSEIHPSAEDDSEHRAFGIRGYHASLAVGAGGRVALGGGSFQSKLTVLGSEPHEIDGASAVAFSPDGKSMAAATHGHVRLLRVEGWERRLVLETFAPTAAVRDLAFSPRGDRLAICGGSDGVRIWDIAEDRVLRVLPGWCSQAAFVEADTLLVGDDDGRIEWRSIVDGRSHGRWLGAGAIVDLQRTRHGSLVVSADGMAVLLANDVPREPRPEEERAFDVFTLGDYREAERMVLFESRGDSVGGCLLDKSRKISCWGNNDAGQLGNGDGKPRAGLVSVVQAASQLAVADHSTACALGDDGTIRCWGDRRLKPEPIGDLVGVTAMDVRRGGGCGVVADRTVRCWHRDREGVTSSHAIIGMHGASTLAVGAVHGCAIDRAGQAWCWGSNHSGQLGFGRPSETGPVHAVKVRGLDDAVSIAAGSSHSCAIRKAGTVACWGSGARGELGDDTYAERAFPVEVVGVRDAVELALGGVASCARTKSGAVWCWGGDVPPGDRSNRRGVAVRVPDIDDAVAIDTSCAIRKSGRVTCWGDRRVIAP
jgi:WD40 repeat protein